MPYVNDMQTLANVVGSGAAAEQMGIQNDLENQRVQLENERYAGQNPAEIAAPALKNLFTQEQIAGQHGIAQQEQAKGTAAQALLPSEIKTSQAELGTKYNAAQVQQFGQMGQMAGQIAGLMDGVPPAARPAVMNQIAQKYGIEPDKLGILMSGDPDQLRNFSQKMIQSSQDYQTKYMQEQEATQRATGVAQIGASGRVAGAEASANARVQAAQLMAQTRQQQQTFEQAAVQAEKNGNHQLAQQFAQAATLMKQAQANLTSNLVGQGGVAQALPQFGGGNAPAPTGAPAAQVPQAPPSDDKYEYRIGPDGQVQRRAK